MRATIDMARLGNGAPRLLRATAPVTELTHAKSKDLTERSD